MAAQIEDCSVKAFTQPKSELKSYIVEHIQIYRHELHSGVGRTAIWKRPSLAQEWASKC